MKTTPFRIAFIICDSMKDQSLIIIEHHPPYDIPPNQAIRQTITAWLTKELHK